MAYQFAPVGGAASSEAIAAGNIDPLSHAARISRRHDGRPDARRHGASGAAATPASAHPARRPRPSRDVRLCHPRGMGLRLHAAGQRRAPGCRLPASRRYRPPQRSVPPGQSNWPSRPITETVVAEISLYSRARARARWPEIFVLFLRLQSKMLSALVGQLADIGRRDARARVAQLLLKLERRLMRIGHAGPDGYDCPISQYLIADALGLTAIHVNRVLEGLREEGVVTLRGNRVTIHDRARLMAIAGEGDVFDEGRRRCPARSPCRTAGGARRPRGVRRGRRRRPAPRHRASPIGVAQPPVLEVASPRPTSASASFTAAPTPSITGTPCSAASAAASRPCRRSRARSPRRGPR